MFYVYLTAGFALFGVGLVIIPGWWKLPWVAGCFVVMEGIPGIWREQSLEAV